MRCWLEVRATSTWPVRHPKARLPHLSSRAFGMQLEARAMHPDRMGKSKWAKVLPWHYTTKRQASRHTVEREAMRREGFMLLRGGDGAEPGRIAD